MLQARSSLMSSGRISSRDFATQAKAIASCRPQDWTWIETESIFPDDVGYLKSSQVVVIVPAESHSHGCDASGRREGGGEQNSSLAALKAEEKKPASASSTSSASSSSVPEEAVVVEEDLDEHVLGPVPSATSASSSSAFPASGTVTVHLIYHVAYSPSFQVPLLLVQGEYPPPSASSTSASTSADSSSPPHSLPSENMLIRAIATRVRDVNGTSSITPPTMTVRTFATTDLNSSGTAAGACNHCDVNDDDVDDDADAVESNARLLSAFKQGGEDGIPWLSQLEHPVLGYLLLGLHPCHTADLMALASTATTTSTSTGHATVASVLASTSVSSIERVSDDAHPIPSPSTSYSCSSPSASYVPLPSTYLTSWMNVTATVMGTPTYKSTPQHHVAEGKS